MPRLLQLVHGYPPREAAGTEQYARRVAEGLAHRGWSVHTLAVAPAPGRPMYARAEEAPARPGGPRLTRLANNAPYAGLRAGARDAAIDRVVRELAADADIVHVQHLAFLSVGFRVTAPIVWTLHDAWAWCPAGGLLLRDGRPCDGPGADCPRCATGWAKDTPALATALGVAGRLGGIVPPERLQAAWRRLPAGLRARVVDGPPAPVPAEALARRTRNIRRFADRCARIVSPSRWLAEAARGQGIPVTDVLPHGVDPLPTGGPPPTEPRPFLFLGTLAPHKGPDLVREAWARAGTGLPLRVHGPPGPDAAWAARIPNDGPLPASEVPSALRGAQALVLGSIWPENAPLVVLEARAAGCPVIAPAIGGLPELVEAGVDGWLYPPGDVEALARCLREAAAHRPAVRPPPSLRGHLDALEGLYAALAPA